MIEPIIINRHGAFDAKELYRLLKPGGIFISQQVGADNDKDFVKMVLPDIDVKYEAYKDAEHAQEFIDAGFDIKKFEGCIKKMEFYDVGAFVWFAHIIEWEFSGFSVDKCFDQLVQLQEKIDTEGKIVGLTHRYFIVAKK